MHSQMFIYPIFTLLYIYRYRMIFVYFGFYLVHHVLLLSVTVPFMWGCRQTFSLSTEFVWLVALPVVIAVFAVLAGLLCKSHIYL